MGSRRSHCRSVTTPVRIQTIKRFFSDGVAPIIDRSEAPPTFYWDKGNNSANDTFHLIIWSDDTLTSRTIDNILIPGNVNDYTLTAADWASVDAVKRMEIL